MEWTRSFTVPEDYLQSLCLGIERVLLREPHGISEFELIQTLRADAILPIERDALSTRLGLFRIHFLVFHGLYRLRLQWLDERQGVLEISPLKIQLLPYFVPESGVQEQDPLQTYYLDLSHFTQTSEEDVESLLDQFWQGFARGKGALVSNEDRTQALDTLGLSDPITDAEIKIAYRRLAMQHHPDRGGDTETLQEINQAAAVLLG